jgi:diacylglycerol kinase (ATP)
MAAPAQSETHTSTKTAAVVFNPIKVNEAKLRAAVSAAESAAGWGESLFFETSGADIVMAAGGDGTIRAVAEALRGSKVAIGLLPSGTGNLLARNLHLTLDNLAESVATAFTGKDRKIDLGIVKARREDGSEDSHVFLVMAGVGLDAAMLANTNPKLKARVGWLAYVDAIARSLKGSNRLRIRYQLDGAPARTLNAHTVLIGNCGSLPANILLLPEAVVDDGIFDIVALRPDGFIGWVQIWIKIVWENGVLRRSQVGRKLMSLTKEVRTLRYMKGAQLVLRLEDPQEFELDGDPFGEAIALKVSVDPLALTVRIPADKEIG